MKKIVLTGGGSAGHVTPHLALLPRLKAEGWDISYIGTYNGIERELMESKVAYYPISAGKLRRYFDWRNFTDPLRVMKGLGQALGILGKLRPQIIFSKGGFVSVPVAVAARVLGIPVILHESDFTPGLANRLALPFATHICVTFPETVSSVPRKKASVTGTPIRPQILGGDLAKGLEFLGFLKDKPVLLVIGGSLGSVAINQAVREALADLTSQFQVAHICGKGNLDPQFSQLPGYRQYEFVSDELADLFAASSIVISRAGANAIFELLALRKPNLLIPLSKKASRGDQILNANSFAEQGFSLVLPEEELTNESLVEKVTEIYQKRKTLVENMAKSQLQDSGEQIIQLINRIKRT